MWKTQTWPWRPGSGWGLTVTAPLVSTGSWTWIQQKNGKQVAENIFTLHSKIYFITKHFILKYLIQILKTPLIFSSNKADCQLLVKTPRKHTKHNFRFLHISNKSTSSRKKSAIYSKFNTVLLCAIRHLNMSTGCLQACICFRKE